MKVLIKGPVQTGGGDQYRLLSLCQVLSKYCDLILIKEEGVEDPELEKIFVRIYSFNLLSKVKVFNSTLSTILPDLNPDYHLSILRILEQEKPDICQITYPQGILSAKLAIKIKRTGQILIYDAHNVEADRTHLYSTYSSLFTRYFRACLAKVYVPLCETIAVKLADHIITISNADKKRFIEKYRILEEKVSVVPMGIFLPDIKKLEFFRTFYRRKYLNNLPYDKIVMFHGLYRPATKNTIDIIINKIAPKVKNALFLIVGRNMPKFKYGNVLSIGYVKDLYSIFAAADIGIVPLAIGTKGGVRTKILDYMACCKPVIATKEAIEGIELENNKHAIIVESFDERFIKAINYLLENEDESKRIGKNARKFVEDKHDVEKIGKNLYSLYKRLLESQRDK